MPFPIQAEPVAYQMLQAVKDLPEPARTFVLSHADYTPIGAAAKRAGITRAEALDLLDEPDVMVALRMCRDPALQAVGVGMQYQLSKVKEIIEYGTEQDQAFDKMGNPIGERMKDAFNAVKALDLLAKLTGMTSATPGLSPGTMSDKVKAETFGRVRDALRARLRAGESIEATFSRPVDVSEAPEGLFE